MPLRVGQRTQLRRDTASDRRSLAGGLEAGEVRAIPPCKWSAQPHSGSERGIVDNVDGSLVVRCPLGISGEVSEIPACREYGSHSGNLGDGIGVLETF